MNSLACETEVHVQNENALRFSIVSKPVPLLEYIKTISSLVGASHILAIFEESESLKVFFDDKRYVNALIRSGIHVMGRHVKIDYVVPPGTKLVLSNVDPVITNMDIINILSSYGTVVSPVIRPPISDDTELCHIGYGVRYVYMNLNVDVPPMIPFHYGDQYYMVKAKVDDRPFMISIPFIKTDDSDETATVSVDLAPGPSRVQNDVESVVNVESEPNSTLQIVSSVSLKASKVRRGRRGRPRRELYGKPKKASAISQAARRIRKNVKHQFLSVQKSNLRNINVRSRKPMNQNKMTDSVEAAHLKSDDEMQPDKVKHDNLPENNANIPYKPVLDMRMLLMFLDEVKGHRAPLELARKYIGESYTPNSVHLLCQQMRVYNASHNDLNLKHRIMRLIKIMKDAM